jgi:hypothetical protein
LIFLYDAVAGSASRAAPRGARFDFFLPAAYKGCILGPAGGAMEYTIPMVADAQGNPQAVFCTHTTQGKVVIVFTSTPRWKRFAAAVSVVLSKESAKLAGATVEADSLDELVARIAKIDPAMMAEATVLPDSAPLYADVVEYFERLAA